MNKKFIIWVGLSLFFLGGCAASQIDQNMKSWVGHHQDELKASWGEPVKTIGDGKGGNILIYDSYVYLVSTFLSSATYYPTKSSDSNGYNRVRRFYVDSDGYVYSWRWERL